MQYLWDIEDWKRNIDLERSGHRSGVRLRFDREVGDEIRGVCKEYVAFLRRDFFFPIRILIYVEAKEWLIGKNGNKCRGIFWCMPDDYTVEPDIHLAVGDYEKLCAKHGKDEAVKRILLRMGYELTHYFQWINGIDNKLTPIGIERQATKYARYVLDDYAETRDHP